MVPGNRLHGWLAAVPDMGRGGAAYHNAAALLHRTVRYGMVAKGSVASDLPNGWPQGSYITLRYEVKLIWGE